jgi:hypothetical protein
VGTAVYLILAAACARAADVPMTLVSEDEAEPIHSAIVRKEAWTQDAVRRLRACLGALVGLGVGPQFSL